MARDTQPSFFLSPFLLGVTILLLHEIPVVQGGSCTCNLPAQSQCVGGCQTCNQYTASCQCTTGCTDGGCSAGYTQVSSSWCPCWCGFSRVDYTCRQSATIVTSTCATCKSYHYGPTCQPCPGQNLVPSNPCNVAQSGGTCSDTISGTGLCRCNPGFFGSYCQHSNLYTCSNHGTADATGRCVCATGYNPQYPAVPLGATQCSACNANYYRKDGNCIYCLASESCGAQGATRGVCTPDGKCDCYTGYIDEGYPGITGLKHCTKCDTANNYVGIYPNCRECLASTTCNSHGVCDAVGLCACFAPNYVASVNCNVCASGYYSNNCNPCPGGALTPCNGLGTCSQGYLGTGVCACSTARAYHGTACNNPVVEGITPLNGPTSGVEITITGTLFGTAGILQAICPSGPGCYGGTIQFPSNNIVEWTDSRIRARTPPHYGPFRVLVIVNSLQSKTDLPWSLFRTDPPVITALSPNLGNTRGYLATITGTSLGSASTSPASAGNLTIVNWSNQPISVVSWEHTQIVVSIPSGNGAGYNMFVRTRTPPMAVTPFGYFNPVITSAVTNDSSPVPTPGGVTLYITGQNFFGGSSQIPQANPVVTVNSLACTDISFTDNAINCTAPQGRGLKQTVGLIVGTLTGNAQLVDYAPPTITRVEAVSGQCSNTGQGVTLCNPGGHDSIRIYGYNLGETDAQPYQILVNGAACGSILMTTPHRVILCQDTPTGYGANATLSITRDGQTGSAYLFGYASATIYTGSLTRDMAGAVAASEGGGRTMVQASTVQGGDIVTFQGNYLGTDQNNVKVYYGDLDNPLVYSCTVIYANNTFVRCRTQSGVGGHLVFTVKVLGLSSLPSEDYYSYPAPVLESGSLALLGEYPPAFPPVYGKSNNGDAIRFFGNHFGLGNTTVPFLQVTLVNGSQVLGCTVDAATANNTYVVCQTVKGFIQNLRIQVCAGPGAFTMQCSALSNPDVYSYPVPPRVDKITGCPTDVGAATTDCATDTLATPTTITLEGDDFGTTGAGVTVGSGVCFPVEHDPVTPQRKLRCSLPSGVGLQVSVVVNKGVFFSVGSPLVSYHVPVVDRVAGCVTPVGLDNVTTVECSRFGGDVLTIGGQYFGAARARVLIGGADCVGVQHGNGTQQHRYLTCLAPAGTGLDKPVLVIQDQGEISGASLAAVSWKQCGAGEFGFDLNCTRCSPGQFSNVDGQAQCLQCPSGTFSAYEGLSECEKCDVGRFASSRGSQDCVDCGPGTYTAETGQPVCSQCPPGTASADNKTTACVECSFGSFAGLPGSTSCAPCPRGSATFAIGSISCPLCEPGFAQNTTGQVSCVACPPGQRSQLGGSKGSFVCEDCVAGSFSPSGSQSSCTGCPAGRYINLPGQSSCLQCGPGTFSAAPGAEQCTQCHSGRYSSAYGATTCQPCGVGTMIASDGEQSCRPCVAGKFQNSTGQTLCYECELGRYSASPGQAACIACEAGLFANQSNPTRAVHCDACPPGTFSEGPPLTGGPGAVECSLCQPGTFSNFPGFSECATCAVGTYADGEATTQCTPCEPGRFSGAVGALNCSQCVPGSFAAGVGTTQCDQCTPGKYSPDYNTSTCIRCEPGRFQPGFGKSECIDCPLGSSAYFDGSTECFQCPSGRIGNETGLPYCFDCPVGRFSQQNRSMGATECFDCELGKYGQGSNRALCDDCDAGKYQDAPGQAQCVVCPPGRFANDHGTIECLLCPPGRFNLNSGQRQCSLCSPGQYQPDNGTYGCLECDPGTFQLQSGQAQCDGCPPGTYNTAIGRPLCTPCSAGTAFNGTGLDHECPACGQGSFQANTGESICERCTAGRYNSGVKQVQCRNCEAGKATNFTGQTDCQPCDPGFYTPTTGNVVCGPCGVGTYQGGNNSATFCTQCQEGKYAPRIAAKQCDACPPGRFQQFVGKEYCDLARPGHSAFDSAGAQQQKPCNEDPNDPKKTLVAPYAGMSTCYSCDLHGAASEEQDGCLCEPGYFSANIQSPHDLDTLLLWFSIDAALFNTTQPCIPCPLGADCSQSGVTQSSLSSLVGWWRAGTDMFLFHRCLFTWHCDGDPRRNSTCGNDRAGVICATCKPGYRSATGYSKCQPCGSYSQSVGVSIVFLLLVVAALLLMYYIVLRNDRPLMMAAAERDRKVVEWEVEDKEDGLSNAPVLSMESRSRPNLTYKLKIVVGFLQIMTNLVFIVQIPWPSYFSQFITVFDFLNLNFVPWQSLGCATQFTYYTKWLVITITPICIMAALVLFFLLPMYILDRRDMSDDELYRAARKRTRKKFWKLALFTLFLLYPGVSSTVLSMMICKDIDGTYYLLRDFSIQCWDSQWFDFMPATVIMTLLYPIGVPLFLLYLLRQYRPHMLEPDIRVQLGFLYEAYNTDMWYFELCDMMHKLCLTSVVGFFDVYAQMPLALCAVTAYIILILAGAPYVRRSDDQLHLFVQVEMYLIIDAGMILFNQNTQSLDEATDVLLSALLIFLCCCLFLLFLVMFAFSLRKLWRLRIRNKVLEAQRKALVASGQQPDDTMAIENAMGDRLLRRSHSKSELAKSRQMSVNPIYDAATASPSSKLATVDASSTDAGERRKSAFTSGSPRQQKLAAVLSDDSDNFPTNTDDVPVLHLPPTATSAGSGAPTLQLTPDVMASLNRPAAGSGAGASPSMQISGPMLQNSMFANYMIPAAAAGITGSDSDTRRKTATSVSNTTTADAQGIRIIEAGRKSMSAPRVGLATSSPQHSPRVGLSVAHAHPSPTKHTPPFGPYATPAAGSHYAVPGDFAFNTTASSSSSSSTDLSPVAVPPGNRPTGVLGNRPQRLAHAQPQTQGAAPPNANHGSGVDWE